MDIKKYPKSKHNFQCLGPCYYPSTMIVHPTQLDIVSDFGHPFCPVEEWKSRDPKTGKELNVSTDTCLNPTESKNIINKELEMNILTPYIDFTADQFLKIYYNIYSFKDGIDWLEENKDIPFLTKERVINALLYAYGQQLDIFDQRFTNFFIEYVKKTGIRNIYNKINKYIGIENGEIYLENKNLNKLESNEKCVERINYIVTKFLNVDDIAKFLMRYLNNNKNDWLDMRDHLNNMILKYIDYIINKIELTIKY